MKEKKTNVVTTPHWQTNRVNAALQGKLDVHFQKELISNLIHLKDRRTYL